MKFREWLDQLFELAQARDRWPGHGRTEQQGEIVRWIMGMPLLDWFRDGLSPEAAVDRVYEQPDSNAQYKEA